MKIFDLFKRNAEEKAAIPVMETPQIPEQKATVAELPQQEVAVADAPPVTAGPGDEQYMPKPMGYINGWAGGAPPVYISQYNGEQNFGDLGPIKVNLIDNQRLGMRAWQLDMESETCHTIVKQKGKWLLGTGLRLQCEPQVDALRLLGINLTEEQTEAYCKNVEALWRTYANKTVAMDYKKQQSLQGIAKDIEKNASVWGHILVIHRIDKNNTVTTQLIDGQHVMTPIGLATISSNDKMVDNKISYEFVYTPTGNRVRNGVEIDETGKHVAYHIKNGVGYQFKRIKAYNSVGLLMAYLVYGNKNRLEDTLGIPTMTQNMQSAKQLDDYTSAEVTSAVETARVAYVITHEKGSGVIDPRQQNLAKMVGTAGNLDNPRLIEGKQLANDVAATFEKSTFNLPEGAKIEVPKTTRTASYETFFKTRFHAECASVGIPPEVASQLYGGSYSASRAATNGWQYMLNIDRDDFGDQFYQRVYNLQLLIWVLSGMIEAPGYAEAFYSSNEIVLAAYNYANWGGDPVPQIDALKEVQAIRLMLGGGSAHMPLSTFERSARDLGMGDSDAIARQYAREMEEADKYGIEKVENKGQVIEDFDEPDEDKPGKPAEKDGKKKQEGNEQG